MKIDNHSHGSWRLAAASLVLAAVHGVGAADLLSIDELIERHTQARGGRAAIEAVENMEIHLEITEPTFRVKAVWRGDRAGRMRIDVYGAVDRVFTEAYDGVGAWQMDAAGKVSAVSPAGTRALRHSTELPMNLRGLHELRPRGHAVTLRGMETADGRSEYVVEVELLDGFEIDYYLDSETFMISRSRNRRALHPDIDPTETVIESSFRDYRPVAGVLRNFETIDRDVLSSEQLASVVVTEMRANVAIEDGFFDRPE